MVRKLKTRVELDAADCDAIMALPYVRRDYEAPAYVLREGERPKRVCSFIISGLAFRQKLTATGGRQIVSIQMAGDFIDLQHLFLNRADHSVQALTQLITAEIDREALQDLTLERPHVGRAMWVDALVEASIFREWIVNVGRRDARARVAHLLCEFSLRMRVLGIAARDSYELPMTQEQIGDAVGLTSVHVNRTLKALTEEGLIERDKRHIRIADWNKISAVGDFSALYLHLDQAERLEK
jgi:CRP-like cAMP-binding protein